MAGRRNFFYIATVRLFFYFSTFEKPTHTHTIFIQTLMFVGKLRYDALWCDVFSL